MRMLGPTATLAVICLIGATASCSGESTKDPSPAPSTTSSTPSPTPTGPTEPALPAAARANTPRGAAAFVEYYISLMNYSAATGDTARMQELSSGCVGCTNYIKLYEKTYAAGGYFEDPKWAPKEPIAEREASHVTVLLDVDAPSSKFRLKAKDSVSLGKGGHYKLRYWVRRSEPSWAVTLLAEQGDLNG